MCFSAENLELCGKKSSCVFSYNGSPFIREAAVGNMCDESVPECFV